MGHAEETLRDVCWQMSKPLSIYWKSTTSSSIEGLLVVYLGNLYVLHKLIYNA